jgi:hypothetical protein
MDMSVIEEVQDLTKSPVTLISEAAIKALTLNQDFVNGKLTAEEYNELLEDVVKLDDINKQMEAVETERIIVKAYNTILTLKTIASLI